MEVQHLYEVFKLGLDTVGRCARRSDDNSNKIMTGKMTDMTSDTNHNIIIQSLSEMYKFLAQLIKYQSHSLRCGAT